MSEPNSILVALDLPVSPAHLGPVIELAKATGWRVSLLHAAAPEPDFVGYDAPDGVYDTSRREQELAEERQQLAALVAQLGDLGIEADAHVAVGPTVEVILARAEACDAAFIAIIGHRHSVAHRMVLGSVASSLLKAAQRPVLVLPPPEAQVGAPAAVDRLIDLIDRDERAPDLAALREAAEKHLAAPDSDADRDDLSTRLRDALQRFEAEHPSLTRAINDVSYYLSGMGI